MSEQESPSGPVAPLAGPPSPLAPALPAKSPHAPQLAVIVGARDRRGLLHDLTAAILRHDGLIVSLTVQVHAGRSTVSLEMDTVVDSDGLLRELEQVPHVETVTSSPSMFDVYGKRVIVVGAGAQVGQVAVGAIGEADRHNIRGEKISVDTIPVVGEDALASAVRAVARLPRVSALVLAGSLMGGTIADAVDEVRAAGVLVIALNMVGSVPAHADLVVTDPLQAGVMSVMAVASTARFDIARVRGRRL